MKTKEPIILIKDDSDLSKKVEDFLIENKMEYNVLYSNKEDIPKLPLIYTPLGSFPLEGKAGFNIFKYSHQNCA